MSTPYYSDEHVTLYLGDCLEIDEWLEADVLVTLEHSLVPVAPVGRVCHTRSQGMSWRR